MKTKNIPTIGEILKELDKGAYKAGRHEFLADVFKCGAIAISNKFDIKSAEKREKVYLSIIKRYDKNMQILIAEIFAKMFGLLSSQIEFGFNDYLGELYMKSETSNSKAGQFFTPYSISKTCAKMVIDENKVNKCIKNDEIMTLHEPACGAGGMVLAVADTLYNEYDFNISRNLFVKCWDIDERCIMMTYLQLSLAGIPAVIYQGNSLTMEVYDRWETPAYILQWLRFRKFD